MDEGEWMVDSSRAVTDDFADLIRCCTVTPRIACLLALSALTAFGQIKATAVGHEFRQDDWPSIAASPDGSLWVTWLSYVGERDDLAIRHYKDGQWSNLQWVPNTSGDNWMPQAGVDAQNRVWVVWPQQVNGNWDIYARRYDPAKQEWSALERLSSDPGSDSNIRLGQRRQRQTGGGVAGIPRQEQQRLLPRHDRREMGAGGPRHQSRGERLGAGRGIRRPRQSLGRLRQLQERQLRRLHDRGARRTDAAIRKSP